MSYILDALKRADAERGRGTVPGLHAQPIPGVASGEAGAGALGRWLLLGVVLLGGLAAGLWLWLGRDDIARPPVAASPVPRPSPAMAQAVPAPMPTPPVAAQSAVEPAPPPAPVAPVAPAARIQAASPAAAPAPAPAAALVAPAPSVSIPAKPKAQASPVPATAAATATATATTTATATAITSASAATPAAKPASAVALAPATAPPLSELPEETRRLIPALAITGAVYSENPGQRLLLVNGQVLPQGASAAPEVTIDEIKARSATFSFRGTRFRVTY